jgi:hypothetical protein
MPQVGFEPMIPVLKRAKTVHALDRAATVVAVLFIYLIRIFHALLISSILATWLLQHGFRDFTRRFNSIRCPVNVLVMQ